MNALADDIEHLQRAADAAGLVIYPGSSTTVRDSTLMAMAVDLEARRNLLRDYTLIDCEAVWLVKAALMLLLHRADGNAAKAERFQKLAEYLRAAVEIDLVNARKSLAVMG